MSAIDKKLLRDLGRLKGQVVTIALVVACGVAAFVTLQSAYASLLYSRDAYYDQYRFADVFAHLERAPESLRHDLERVPGVARVYTRVVEQVMVPMPQMARPAVATLLSVPSEREAPLNQVHLTRGRMPEPERADEVLVLDAFARAHELEPGRSVPAVINGTLRDLRIVGTAMSPEFVMTIPPGAMSHDPKRAAVFWMNREVVEAAFRMEGGFNDVVLDLQPGASEPAVLEAVDGLLRPYGGVGALPRAKQPSNFMLNGELEQLRSMATTVPFIFLFVAAFLLNVVLSRLVYLQRSQIATLKAVGYTDREIGVHFLKLVSLIVLLGAGLGLGLGAWLGSALTDLYTGEFFRFPEPSFRLGSNIVLVSVGVSLAAAVAGALGAVRHVTRMPPAEAMRPPAPLRYRRTLLELVGLFKLFGPAARMVLREVQRRPLRLLLSSVGIAFAVGIVVVGRFMFDAVDQLLDVQFHRAMREDVTVLLQRPLSDRAVSELEHVPGVFYAEALLSVPVRFRSGHRHRDSTLIGYPGDAELRRLVERSGEEAEIPKRGVLLTKMLGQILDVDVGDEVEVELREGDWGKRRVVVAGFADEAFGLQGHMELEELERLLRTDEVVSTVLLHVDRAHSAEIYRRLKELPWVLGVSDPRAFREQFEEQSGSIMRVYTLILTLFASVIAVGIVYNNARVSLSQRSRDLASLRVLGFSQAEVSVMLLGELSVQVLLAIPVGLVLGYLMTTAMMNTVDPETYRLPITISTRTYAYASVVAVASAVVSALLVRRKLASLDLIGVLKTRE